MGLSYGDLTECQMKYSFAYIADCENGNSVSKASWAADTYGVDDYLTIGILQWMGPAALSLIASLYELTGITINNTYIAKQMTVEEAEQYQREIERLRLELPEGWRDDAKAYLESRSKEIVSTGITPEAGDASSFQGRYMTGEEHNAWVSAINGHLDAARFWQQWYWFSDKGMAPRRESLRTYMAAMSDAGIDCSSVKTLFYYMQAWHNAPAMARYAWSVCGDTPDLASIGSACLNWLASYADWGQFGDGWTNRYAGYAVSVLDAWDGQSCPPDDFGTTGEGASLSPGAQSGVTGSAAYGMNSGPNRIKAIYTNGQDLICVSASDQKLLCHRANGGNVWIPSTSGTGGTSGGGGASGSGPATDPYDGPLPQTGWKHAQELFDELNPKLGTFTYSQTADADRNWRVNGGVTDCSGLVWWGIDGYDHACASKLSYGGGAGYTGSIYDGCGGSQWAVAEGLQGQLPDESKMLPGDLVMCNYSDPYFVYEGGNSGMHVGMYFGADPGVIHQTIGTTPLRQSLSDFLAGPKWWIILRPPYSETL